MSDFICGTEGCVINSLKGVYPNEDICPECNKKFIRKPQIKPKFEKSVENIINNYPYAIAYQFKLAHQEPDYRNKIKHLNDSFNNYLRYIALMAATEFYECPFTDKKTVNTFQDQLYRPTFGKWAKFTRICLQFLNQKKWNYFIKELPVFFNKVDERNEEEMHEFVEEAEDSFGTITKHNVNFTGGHALVVKFRNEMLGHGQTPNKEKAKKLWDVFYPIFRSLLEEMKFVVNYPMYKQENGKVWNLMSAEIKEVVAMNVDKTLNVWVENSNKDVLKMPPFYVNLNREESDLFIYDGADGISITYQSPKYDQMDQVGGLPKQLLEWLHLKEKSERPITPSELKPYKLQKVIREENEYVLSQLINEKKVIPNIYQHREKIELDLKEWLEGQYSIFFIAAEAGSGKTNLLVEMQKQFERKRLKCLLILSGRMQKSSLVKEFNYILNLDESLPISHYKNLAGSQKKPVIILIDALNENQNPLKLWQEVKNLARVFKAGTFKIVVTSRVNGPHDLSRYEFSKEDQNLFYKIKPDHQLELASYTHWLTPLNMVEMEAAWKLYIEESPSTYNPKFSFDDIASFDRNLYNVISNPLVLRLFLKTYQGKALPKQKGVSLNLWKQWFSNLSKEEQKLLAALAKMAWNGGENRFLMDNLQNEGELKELIDKDNEQNALNKLENDGWLSIYTRDKIQFVSFTVEASLQYIIATNLIENVNDFNTERIKEIVEEGNLLKIGAIEAYLVEIAIRGEMEFIIELVRKHEYSIPFCIYPTTRFIKTFGVQRIANLYLHNVGKNEYFFLNQLVDSLERNQQFNVLKELFEQLNDIDINTETFDHYIQLRFIKYLPTHNQIDRLETLTRSFLTNDTMYSSNFNFIELIIERNINFGYYKIGLTIANQVFKSKNIEWGFETDLKLLELIGECHFQSGDYNEAFDSWNSALNMILDNNKQETIEVAEIYNSLGCLYLRTGEYNKSFDKLEKAIDIGRRIYGTSHSVVLIHMANLANYYNTVENFNQSKKILSNILKQAFKHLPEFHQALHLIYNTFGWYCISMTEYDKSKEYFTNALENTIALKGGQSIQTADDFTNLGIAFHHQHKISKALSYYKKSQKLFDNLKFKDRNNLINIGSIYQSQKKYELAISYFNRSVDIYPEDPNTLSRLGEIYLDQKDYEKASFQFDAAEIICKRNMDGSKRVLAVILRNKARLCEIYKLDHIGAIDFYKEILTLLKSMYSSSHHDVLFCIGEITRLYVEEKDYSTAKSYLKEWEVIYLKNNESAALAKIFTFIGSIYTTQSQINKALSYYKKSWSLENIGGIAYKIIESYRALNDSSNALKWLEKCALIREKRIGLEHETTQKTYKELIEFATENGNEQIAKKYAEKILIPKKE